MRDIYWNIFQRENKLAFNWMSTDVNYATEKNIKKHSGWTCIDPWVNQMKIGDLIFLFNKFEYAGVAIVEDTYRYKKYDLDMGDFKLPSIPVKFLHKLKTPVSHTIDIEQTSPKTFYYLNGLGFDLFTCLNYIKVNLPEVYPLIVKYISEKATPEKEKISKVCWNDRDWRMPSGELGKDISDNSFEGLHRYGHEEWINNRTHLIDGFYYGFLQTLNLKSNKHVDRIYNIELITNDRQGIFYKVGIIKNAICISKDESKYVYNIYKKNSWLDTMREELQHIQADHVDFNRTSPNIMFNVKYLAENITIYPDKLRIENQDFINIYRYKLLDKEQELKILDPNTFDPDDENEDDDRSTKRGKRKINAEVYFDPIHNEIQNALKRIFRDSKQYKKVRLEKKRVDVSCLTHDDKWHFYEVKTYGTAKKCVRHALGQLFEYSYWFNANRAEKLFIVSDNKIDTEITQYMKHLRELTGLEIYYRCCTKPDKLSEPV